MKENKDRKCALFPNDMSLLEFGSQNSRDQMFYSISSALLPVFKTIQMQQTLGFKILSRKAISRKRKASNKIL